MERIVIALGGNALLPPGRAGDLEAMVRRVQESSRVLADLAAGGSRLVVTHGNGPQVGNLLLQADAARAQVSPPTLDVLVAETQAQIGYLLQQGIRNELDRRKTPRTVVTVITQVVVDPHDPAFHEPTKPVGPIIPTETEAMLKRAKGWTLKPDPRGGWRRVVPSPRPLEVIEADAIRNLLDAGFLVIAAGGGGIPVVREGDAYVGIEAVVDKDLTSAVLARALGAERLVLATDVERVALNFGKAGETFLDRMSVEEARRYLGEGHFPAGSMGPKIEAAVEFVASGGREAVVGSLAHLREAVQGSAGTRIVP